MTGERPRPPWDFGYAPVSAQGSDDEGAPLDAVVALAQPAPPERLVEALGALDAPGAPGPGAHGARVEPLLEEAPLFWYRARAATRVRGADAEAALASRGLPVRYVASSRCPSLLPAPPWQEPPGAVRGRPATRVARSPHAPHASRAASRAAARPERWRARRPSRDASRAQPATPPTAGFWFLRAEEGGVGVDRARFGAGAGTRLAVIDDDAAAVEYLQLDDEVLVLVERAPRSNPHGALMVAWAAGCGPGTGDFRGVAPDASPRLYLIPKPGASVLALPLAIARAALDGADVILCATYVEGCTSPMLDDALELAWRRGRGGRGALVVLPTGREASSPAGSLHSSFSLGFGEPASDPRVFCVGPSARGEGWFLWRDRKGRSRPFANRGPAVRWLAPGDDMAYPFRALSSSTGPPSERLHHAESSGASAIASGALLLVLAQNPALCAEEIDAIVTLTLDPVAPGVPGVPAQTAPLADPSDLLPGARDRDSHNAKHGYGRINAGRACLAAADPVALALVIMGEDSAARAWHDLRRADASARRLYSRRLGRWAVRALLADGSLLHAARALLRHARLIAGRDARRRAHGAGAMLRHLALLLRGLAASRLAPRPERRAAEELAALRQRVELAARAPLDRVEAAEAALADLARQVLWIAPDVHTPSEQQQVEGDRGDHGDRDDHRDRGEPGDRGESGKIA